MIATPAASASESGKLLLEMVRDVCLTQGFSVETNVESQANSGSFVDIVASRTSGKRKQRIAFECWERNTHVTAKEIESFLKRFSDLRVKHGVYVSPKGFTGDAEFVAREHGIELWDMHKLKEQLARIETPERTKVPDTLPISKMLATTIFSSKLVNGSFLKVSSLPRLEFRPYYFAKFEVQKGHRGRARGVLVFDGVDGRACDAKLLDGHALDGHRESLPSTGFFIDCLEVEPLVGHMPKLPEHLGMSNTVTVAPVSVGRTEVPQMTQEALKAKIGDADVVDVKEVRMLHIPIVTLELKAGQRPYRKIVQAATGKMIWDETMRCLMCDHASRGICEVCCRTICENHLQRCESCRKHLCTDCTLTKGVWAKRALCPSCKNS